MKDHYRKLIFLSFMVFSYIIANAQIKIEKAGHAPGTLKKESKTLDFIRKFKVLPDAKAVSLANTANKMMDEICRSPHLNPPTGYNAKVNVAGSDLGLKEKEPRLTIFCYLRYLTRDSRYPGIKESMDGADLYLNVNAFDAFHQMGNYWEDCNKLKFPLFFEEPVFTNSTNDYIEFQYKGSPLRIVTAGSKPLLVPLTRKGFIQFLVVRDEQAIKDEKEALSISHDGEEQIKKMMVSQNEKDKAYSASTLKSMDYAIDQRQKNITQIEKEVGDCRSLLNTITPQDANAPARVDYNKKGGLLGMGSLDRLLPVGSREGVMLVKVNPDFYDRSPSAPVVQMMTLYYAWPTVGFAKDPDYLQQAMLDIFNHLDYHQLKECMK